MAVGEALFVIDFCCGAPGYSIFSSGDILVCTERVSSLSGSRPRSSRK